MPAPKPDYTLWVASDAGKGRAGAAWKNEDGSISIAIDPYVILKGRGHSGAPRTVMLYPAGSYEARKKAEEEAAAKVPDGPDDDIPF